MHLHLAGAEAGAISLHQKPGQGFKHGGYIHNVKKKPRQAGGRAEGGEADDDDESARFQANFARNSAWTKPEATDFNTRLGQLEPAFRQWVKNNSIPFDPKARGPQDYDMRGFWKGMRSGDPIAASAIDPNDSRLHYPDYWKTPYHETFSSESQWAAPGAPSWNGQDQLVTPDGQILFDDRAPKGRAEGGRVPGELTEANKHSHQEVGYVSVSPRKRQRCELCTKYIKDGPACKKVQSPIAAGAWCKRFVRKPGA